MALPEKESLLSNLEREMKDRLDDAKSSIKKVYENVLEELSKNLSSIKNELIENIAEK